MNLQYLQNRARDLFGLFALSARHDADVSHTDSNKIAETILVQLLKEIYQLEGLRNLNDSRNRNYPAIDLADDENKIAFQVTATREIGKVKETLQQFVKRRLYEKYERLVIYVLKEKQRSYDEASLSKIIDGRFKFSPQDDIWDSGTLLAEIFSFPPDRLSRVVSILETNIGPIARLFTIRPFYEADLAQPYLLQENFVGRRDERNMLTEWLTKSNQPIMAVVAIGGMGKSALTWVWLQHDVRDSLSRNSIQSVFSKDESSRVPLGSRPEGVLWWSFHEHGCSFAAFLDRALHYTSGKLTMEEVSELPNKMYLLKEQLYDRRFLLVLDGFERELQTGADGKNPVVDFLKRLTSPSMQSRVLITSRYLPPDLQGLAGVRCYNLESLKLGDAVEFFRAQKVRGTRPEIQLACEPYGYFPLYLRLLAGIIMRDARSPGDVRVAFRQSVMQDLGDKEGGHILSVAYNTLPASSRLLLSSIAAFRGPTSYEALSIFNPYATEKQFGATLRELVERGLLSCDSETERYDLHPIVRQYAYGRLSEKQRKSIHRKLSHYFAKIGYKHDVNVRKDLDTIIEQYHHTVQSGRYKESYAMVHDKIFGPLHYRLGDYLTNIRVLRELFQHGEDTPPRLSKRLEQTEMRPILTGTQCTPRPGYESPQVWAMTALGISYRAIGSPRSAEKLFKAANDISEQLGDKNNLITGLVNLSDVQWTLGDFKSVDDNLRRQICLSKEMGSKSLETIGHQDLGLRLAFRGFWDEADKELATALAFSREAKDSHREAIIRSHMTRKDLLMIRGNPEKLSRSFTRKVLDNASEIARLLDPVGLAERHRVRAYWLLGESYRVYGYLAQAKRNLETALEKCRNINLMEFEPDILLSIAELYVTNKNFRDAREYAEAALRIAERCDFVLGKADSHIFLAKLLLQMGDRDLAGKHANEALAFALCSGPPDYTYKVVYDQAGGFLRI